MKGFIIIICFIFTIMFYLLTVELKKQEHRIHTLEIQYKALVFERKIINIKQHKTVNIKLQGKDYGNF